jgi:hypothetical protein
VSGTLFVSNAIVRDSKCPQADFEVHADANEFSRVLLVPGDLTEMPHFTSRLDVTTNHVISDSQLLPATATVGSVVSVIHAQLSNMRECSYVDRYKNETKKFWTYEMKVGRNPNTLNLSCWDSHFCFQPSLTSGAHANIVGLKLVLVKNRLQYSSTAVTVFFWDKKIPENKSVTLTQTPSKDCELEELEEVETESALSIAELLQMRGANPARQRDDLEPLGLPAKIARTETPQSTPMLTPSASTPSAKPTPTKVSPSLSPATKLDLLALHDDY